MDSVALRKRLLGATLELPADAQWRPLVYVDSGQQRLYLVATDDSVLLECAVSTSRYGLGYQEGSHQTPGGFHRIAQKIGDGEVEGRVFRGRQPVDEVCLPEQYAGKGDLITTRILWLDGLEAGRNRGQGIDSHDRYIYIHGTPDEAHIGQPASIGCVRMRNADVIELFERVRVNDVVLID